MIPLSPSLNHRCDKDAQMGWTSVKVLCSCKDFLITVNYLHCVGVTGSSSLEGLPCYLTSLFKFLLCKMKQEIPHNKVNIFVYYPFHPHQQQRARAAQTQRSHPNVVNVSSDSASSRFLSLFPAHVTECCQTLLQINSMVGMNKWGNLSNSTYWYCFDETKRI